MPISSNLVTATQTRIDALTSSCCASDFALAATAATEMSCYDSSRKVTVATIDNLPNVETTGIGPGHIIFVESIGIPVMSYEQGWMGLDRRVLRKDIKEGKLWVWGCNNSGQLGTGNTTSRSSPVTTAGGGTNWCQIGVAKNFSSAVKTDGTLWTWGSNLSGQLGTGNTTPRSSPVTTAGGGNTWRFVSGGGYTASAIKTDGTLWSWGSNDLGQLGTGNTTCYSSPVTTADGGINWYSVSVGCNHSAAIKTDGTLWSWGYGGNGRLGNNNAISYSSPVTTAGGGTTWSQVSAGGYHTAAIKTDGTLWAWGLGSSGQLGTGNATCYSSPVTTAGGGTTWCQVSAGGYAHTAAIKTDGTLWTWGSNLSGQLGTGNTTNQYSPVTTAGGGTTWCQVSSGVCYKSGIKTDGTLWTWGSNTCGKLGTGDTTSVSSPVTTAGGGNNWAKVFAGVHTAAINLV